MNRVTGFTCAVVASIGYAVIPLLAKHYYLSGGTVTSFLLIRTVCAFLVVMPFIGWFRQDNFALDKARAWHILKFSLVLFVLYLSYFGSVHFIDVSLTVILFFLYPFLTLLIELLLGTEATNHRQLAGFILAFTGLFLAVGPIVEYSSFFGVCLALMAALFMAFDLIVQRRLADTVSPPVYLTYAGLIVCGPLLLFTVISGCDFGSILIVLTAAGVTVISDLCLAYALKLIGSVKCGGIMNLEPVLAVFLAALISKEVLTNSQYLGGAMVFVALYLINRKKEVVDRTI